MADLNQNPPPVPAGTGDQPEPPAVPRADRWALAGVMFVYLLISLAVISDYGVMWDSWEMYTGDRYLAFFTSFDSAYLDLTKPMPMPVYSAPPHPDFYQIAMSSPCPGALRPQQVWPVGPLTSSITKQLLFRFIPLLNPIAAHNAAPVFWSILLFVALFAFVYRLYGRVAAWSAMFALMLHPRFWAHCHFNLKDIPCTTMFALTIMAFWWATHKRSWRWFLAAAVLWGVGLATKANCFFLALVLGPWFLVQTVGRWRRGEEFLNRPMLLSLMAFPFVGIAVGLLLWPYLLLSFPVHIQQHLRYLIFRGMEGSGQWHWAPIVNLILTMPLPTLLLMGSGFVGLRQLSGTSPRSGIRLLILFWLAVPLLRVSVPKADDFDVLRHWLEILPAVAILAGIGAAGAASLVARSRWRRHLLAWPSPHAGIAPLLVVAGCLLWFSPTIVWCVANHPHQLVFYNSLIGGLPGARRHGMPDAGDYWATSYRAACRWLNANAEPDALVIAGNAPQSLYFTQTVWLRPDLQLTDGFDQSLPEAMARFPAYEGPAYVVYVVRPEFYFPWTRGLDQGRRPDFEVAVEGCGLTRIHRLWATAGRLQVAPQ